MHAHTSCVVRLLAKHASVCLQSLCICEHCIILCVKYALVCVHMHICMCVCVRVHVILAHFSITKHTHTLVNVNAINSACQCEHFVGISMCMTPNLHNFVHVRF
jgi:hypothetical protein